MQFSTAIVVGYAYAAHMEVSTMSVRTSESPRVVASPTTRTPLAAAQPKSSAALRANRSSIQQRLDSAEQELSIQFTRIAQLQAELDVLRARVKRSLDGGTR